MNFAHGARRVGRVMKYAVRIHDIKRLVGEVQILCVGGAKCSRQVE